jgi:hypothetical protein
MLHKSFDSVCVRACVREGDRDRESARERERERTAQLLGYIYVKVIEI